jgi:hypothetical protein
MCLSGQRYLSLCIESPAKGRLAGCGLQYPVVREGTVFGKENMQIRPYLRHHS